MSLFFFFLFAQMLLFDIQCGGLEEAPFNNNNDKKCTSQTRNMDPHSTCSKTGGIGGGGGVLVWPFLVV